MKNKPIVIKIGGSTLGQNDTTAEDIVTLQKRKYNLVIVHGGAQDINHWLNKLHIQAKFVNGLRVTDADILDVVTATLCGEVNKKIVSEILRLGGRAVGISGVDGMLIQAKILNPELGYTGEELEVNTDIINKLLKHNYIPVIAPVSFKTQNGNSDNYNIVNVNADTVAAEIAAALEAEKLIFLTDVQGLYDENKSLISRIKASQAKQLISQNIITGGMSVKIKSCIGALLKVSVTRIIDGRVCHALIREVEGTCEGTTIESEEN